MAQRLDDPKAPWNKKQKVPKKGSSNTLIKVKPTKKKKVTKKGSSNKAALRLDDPKAPWNKASGPSSKLKATEKKK